MRSEQNLLADQPHLSFSRALANQVEGHATDLLVNLGQIVSVEHTEQLHEARIVAKRLRYLLEPVRAYAGEAQLVVKRSKKLQELLGDLNDVHVLMREINRILRGFDGAEGESIARLFAQRRPRTRAA